jgi:hypothetical protein
MKRMMRNTKLWGNGFRHCLRVRLDFTFLKKKYFKKNLINIFRFFYRFDVKNIKINIILIYFQIKTL